MNVNDLVQRVFQTISIINGSDEFGYYYSKEYAEFICQDTNTKICKLIEECTAQGNSAKEIVDKIISTVQGCGYIKVYTKEDTDKEVVFAEYILDRRIDMLLDSFCEIGDVKVQNSEKLCNIYIKYTVHHAKINIIERIRYSLNEDDLNSFLFKINEYFSM